MLTIAIGYDPRESIAFYVLAHSIIRRASGPVQIIPLANNTLPMYTRPRQDQSTDFTYTRFLTPYLAGDENNISIFMDCDMLCLGDVYELADFAAEQMYADVCVVKHDYKPKGKTKFLGEKQVAYPCKNWSSVMVFNGHRQACKNLIPEAINKWNAQGLHRFIWANEVGDLPSTWNYLVGEYVNESDVVPKLIHYTNGGPWFPEYRECEYADEWRSELSDMYQPFHRHTL